MASQTTEQQVEKMFAFVAANAHWLTGIFVVFGFVVFHRPTWLWYAVPSFAVLTAVKEFWYDQHYEIPEIRQSNLQDFLFYQLGVVIGLGLYWLSHFVK
jgi:hypothetical protein